MLEMCPMMRFHWWHWSSSPELPFLMATLEPISSMVPNLAHWSSSSFLTRLVGVSVSSVRASNFLLLLPELYLLFFPVMHRSFFKPWIGLQVIMLLFLDLKETWFVARKTTNFFTKQLMNFRIKIQTIFSTIFNTNVKLIWIWNMFFYLSIGSDSPYSSLNCRLELVSWTLKKNYNLVTYLKISKWFNNYFVTYLNLLMV